MGLDLKLLIYLSPESNCAHTQIDVIESYDVMEKIQKVPQLEVRSGFHSYCGEVEGYEGTAYGETMETPYGEPVKFTYAKHLKTLLTYKPAKAYVNELRDDWPIALYWR